MRGALRGAGGRVGRAWRRLKTIRFDAGWGESGRDEDAGPSRWQTLTARPAFTFYLLRSVTLALSVIGLVMVFSASTIINLSKDKNPYVAFGRPLAFFVLGLIVMFVLARISHRVFIRFAGVILVVCVLVEGLVFTPLGYTINGNRNWIHVSSLTLQPSELLKLALVLWLARVLGRGLCDPRSWKSLLKWVGIPVIVVLGEVLFGRDLGTALIFAALVFVMLLVAGVPWRYLVTLAVIGALGVGIEVGISPSRRARVKAFFSDKVDPLGKDLQSLHAKWGLGTGGLTGVGPGASREKWNYLPEAHSDFIYAILGEEFGLIGTLTVIVLFCLLGYGIYRLTTGHPDPAARLVGAGCMGWLLVQAAVNILVVIGIGPVLGVPLPYISQGGSAMVSAFAAMGVLLACARSEPGAAKILGGWRWRGRRAPAVVAAKEAKHV